jgi:hypothetical protein
MLKDGHPWQNLGQPQGDCPTIENGHVGGNPLWLPQHFANVPKIYYFIFIPTRRKCDKLIS